MPKSPKPRFTSKNDLLGWLHSKIGGRDMLDPDVLFEIEDVISDELIAEAQLGNVVIQQLQHGFIKSVEVIR